MQEKIAQKRNFCAKIGKSPFGHYTEEDKEGKQTVTKEMGNLLMFWLIF